MQISLDEAIEIHARVLSKRRKGDAAASAREYAQTLRDAQDLEGYAIWQRVAEAAQRLSNETSDAAPGRRVFHSAQHSY